MSSYFSHWPVTLSQFSCNRHITSAFNQLVSLRRVMYGLGSREKASKSSFYLSNVAKSWLSHGTTHVSEITDVPHVEMCGSGKWLNLSGYCHLLRLLNEISIFCISQTAEGRRCCNSRDRFYHVLKTVSPFREKKRTLEDFRVALTNTQLRLIIFHPCQTKPVSQHLFSCHSPLGAPILRPTAGFHHKTGKGSFTLIPRR